VTVSQHIAVSHLGNIRVSFARVEPVFCLCCSHESNSKCECRLKRVLPHGAMHSANYAVERYPSVCPSVYHTPRYSVETAKYNIFSRFDRIPRRVVTIKH